MEARQALGAPALDAGRLRARPERHRQVRDRRRCRCTAGRRRLRVGRRRPCGARAGRREPPRRRRGVGRAGRHRDQRLGQAPVATGGRDASSSRRSFDGPLRRDTVGGGHGVGGHLRRGRHRSSGRIPRRDRGPRPPRPVGHPGAVRRPRRNGCPQRGVGRNGRGAGMHLTSNPIDWYAARAAGIVAYLLLTAVVALGVSMAGRAPGRRWKRWPMFAVEDVHRAGGLLVGTFIALHVATIAIDSYLPFSLGQLAIPLTAHYRPIWTALGIVAAELLLALAVTNHYRDRIPRRWWRGAHYANFAVWLAATLHGLGSGTDRNAPWMIALFAASAAVVAAAVMWRVGERRRISAALRPGVLVFATAAAAVVVAALALGPLRAHPRPWNAVRFT